MRRLLHHHAERRRVHEHRLRRLHQHYYTRPFFLDGGWSLHDDRIPVIRLTPAAWEKLLEMLERPPAPTEVLRRLMKG